METQKLPITALLPLIVLSAQVGKATKKSLEDGHLGVEDVPNYLPVLPYLQPAFENIGQVPKQFADIDAEEALVIKSELLKATGEVIEDEKLVARIDAGLEWIHASYKLYKTF